MFAPCSSLSSWSFGWGRDLEKNMPGRPGHQNSLNKSFSGCISGAGAYNVLYGKYCIKIIQNYQNNFDTIFLPYRIILYNG